MREVKKILYVITKSGWGGAQKYVYDLANNLPKEKFEAVVAAGGDGPLFDKLRDGGIRAVKIPGLKRDIGFFQELKSLWFLYKIFNQETPNIIHLNSSKIGGLGAIAARLSSLVIRHSSFVIFTAHGWPFSEDRNLIDRNIIYFFSWLTAALSDRVVNITKADHKQSLNFPLLRRDKFVYVQNGIDLDNRHFLPREEARKILGLKKEQFAIGAIAELTKNKGLEYLIEAARHLEFIIPNSKFIIHIIGDGEDKEKIQNQINSLGLKNNIVLAGFIQNAERYLRAFDIFVLPSVKEGLPYVIMEAMASGLPIIASNVGGIPDLIEHGKSGLLVKAKDPLGLAEGLKKLMENPDVRNALGKEAKEIVGTNFRFRDMLAKTLRLYE